MLRPYIAFLNKKYNSTKHSNRTTIKVCSIHAIYTQIYAIIKVWSTPTPWRIYCTHYFYGLSTSHIQLKPYVSKIQLYFNLFSKYRACLQTMPIRARYIQYIQLVDSYIYLKLPELYVTKTRGFVFNVARTIDCIENHGCNEAITCTTLWDKDIKKTLFIIFLQVTMIVRFCYVYQ